MQIAERPSSIATAPRHPVTLDTIKNDLISEIRYDIAFHGWSGKDAAIQLDLCQPDFSALINRKLERFSVDRLLKILIHLGHTPSVDLA